jgi:type IV secretory pathway VirB3-like protein
VEVRVVDSAEICQGAIRPRTLLKVPTEVMMGLIAAVGILWLVLGAWWIVLPTGVLYGWARWQTKRDAYWIRTWWNHLKHKRVYEG